ncbi:hypothetical protein DMH18_26700 [Streptomyces sp. WAC 06783]|uniref:hypothetical protein n=1 Tax=Streptomyces sp. WAC 06783 TaxID=2203211 RepID=UPI000F739FA7|nr:hypothetical protein [Streptomyces sp. WAC 06783]RSO07027.1 hypothetical protein DMH18_26700 [Streptomyces sp. WAC 06783]
MTAALLPEPPGPAPDAPGLSVDSRTLYAWRTRINEAARARHPAGFRVVLYALTCPGGDPAHDLAAAQGLAARLRFDVADRVADDQGESAPLLRPGWCRLRSMLADPASGVHGIIAASRTAVSRDRLYLAELAWLAGHAAGLWLVRKETDL